MLKPVHCSALCSALMGARENTISSAALD